MREQFLWTEKYRPHKVKDLILPPKTKATFQQFVDQKNVPNLLLTGSAGVGKTTIAKAMLEELDADYMMINGSLNAGIDVLRVNIQQFASTISFTGGRKYVILDEADYLSGDKVQPALRSFMEEFAKNCGFILTCNFKNRIIEPLQSRCSIIEFKIDKNQQAKLASLFHKRCLEILDIEKIEYDPAVVAQLVMKFFPDWRRVLNELQKYSATGKIDTGILSSFQEVSINELIGYLKAKKFTDIRKWVSENSNVDQHELYHKLYNAGAEHMTPVGQASLVMILAKYQYQAAFAVSSEINIAACLTEIMIEEGWKK